MSVQSEIDRIAGAKSDISTAITNKGVTVPSGTKLDGMAALIDSIESGGGGSGGGSSQGGFSVTFPAAGSNNYSNWSKFAIAYILKADGTILDIIDYTAVAGQTIDGVVLFTAGKSGGWYGLIFTFKGKVTLYRPNVVTNSPSSACTTFNDTTVNNAMGSSIHRSQFFMPNSDLTITSISAYNTDV